MSSFVAGFMFGALLIGMWAFGYTSELPFVQPPPPPARADAAATPDSGAVAVNDQPAGSSVLVESLTVPPPGVWVAVREIRAGELGNVLGAERVIGPHTDITISLLRATEPGRSYAVQLYRDDGSDTFDLANDSVYVDFTTSAPVIAYFKTTN
jgi:hypothetical protein